MATARDQNRPEIVTDYLFYLSSACLMDAILRGELPELAIQLAFRDPAFQTPFSKLIQDQQFFTLLSEVQQVLFIIEYLHELVQQSAKEREEYLHELATEEEYHYEEFIKHFNDSLVEYNQHVDELIKQQTLELMQLQINNLNKLISTLETMIKSMDARIELLTHRLAVVEQKIAENMAANNDLFLRILEKNSKDMQIDFSDGTSMVVTRTEIMSYAAQYAKDNSDRLFSINDLLPIHLGAAEQKAAQLKKILTSSGLAQVGDHVFHKQEHAKKDPDFKMFENFEKMHSKLEIEYEELDVERKTCISKRETLVTQLETATIARDQYQQILDNPSTPIDQPISISLDSFGQLDIDIDALAAQIDPSLLIDDDLDSSSGLDTAAIMHSIGATPGLSDEDIAFIEPEFDANVSSSPDVPKPVQTEPAVNNKSTPDDPHGPPRITGK